MCKIQREVFPCAHQFPHPPLVQTCPTPLGEVDSDQTNCTPYGMYMVTLYSPSYWPIGLQCPMEACAGTQVMAERPAVLQRYDRVTDRDLYELNQLFEQQGAGARVVKATIFQLHMPADAKAEPDPCWKAKKMENTTRMLLEKFKGNELANCLLQLVNQPPREPLNGQDTEPSTM